MFWVLPGTSPALSHPAQVSPLHCNADIPSGHVYPPRSGCSGAGREQVRSGLGAAGRLWGASQPNLPEHCCSGSTARGQGRRLHRAAAPQPPAPPQLPMAPQELWHTPTHPSSCFPLFSWHFALPKLACPCSSCNEAIPVPLGSCMAPAPYRGHRGLGEAETIHFAGLPAVLLTRVFGFFFPSAVSSGAILRSKPCPALMAPCKAGLHTQGRPCPQERRETRPQPAWADPQRRQNCIKCCSHSSPSRGNWL